VTQRTLQLTTIFVSLLSCSGWSRTISRAYYGMWSRPQFFTFSNISRAVRMSIVYSILRVTDSRDASRCWSHNRRVAVIRHSTLKSINHASAIHREAGHESALPAGIPPWQPCGGHGVTCYDTFCSHPICMSVIKFRKFFITSSTRHLLPTDPNDPIADEHRGRVSLSDFCNNV